MAPGSDPSEDSTVAKMLPHAFFRHPDGSWYRLWVTHTEPKTPRGHPWHVHASYDKSGGIAPVAGADWFEQPYGMANWDFDDEVDALADFSRRVAERVKRGYELREGTVATRRGAVTRGP
jgi:hypothetical protein